MHRSNSSGDLLVTGSSGFIGSHAAARFGTECVQYLDRIAPCGGALAGTRMVDLKEDQQLKTLAANAPAQRILHLAAEAEVMTPWDQVGDVLRSNAIGTYNLVTVYQPRLIVFASTSAVYGNGGLEETIPHLEAAKPLGLYAVSKSMGEILLRDWAHAFRSSAVAFRLGNVVGSRCRGLIPYLVKHARKHPDGRVPARMRGYGKLVRDYVPVQFVVDLFAEAIEQEWEPGTLAVFNSGTGRGTSNGEVAEMVRQVLARHGLDLNIAWEDVATGEADSVILNMDSTAQRFRTPLPTPAQVRQAIEEGVLDALEGCALEGRG